MRLAEIFAKNFLTFGPTGVRYRPGPEYNLIVGPNGAGKTSLFRAVDFVTACFAHRQPTLDSVRHRGDGLLEPQLEVRVRFDEVEAISAADWILVATMAEQLTPRSGSPLGETFDIGAANEIGNRLIRAAKPGLVQLFRRQIGFIVEGTGNPARPIESRVEIGEGVDQVHINSTWGLSLVKNNRSGGFSFDLRQEALIELLKRAPDAIAVDAKKRFMSEADYAEAERLLTLDWFIAGLRQPGQLPRQMQVHGIDIRNYENQLREGPSEARDLSNFLALRGWYNPQVGLRDVLRQILETSIVRIANQRAPPEPAGNLPFHQIPTHYGFISGAELPQALWRLKDSPEPGDRNLLRIVQSELASLMPGAGVDVVLETREAPGPPSEDPSRPAPVQYYQVAALRFVQDGVEFGHEHASAGLVEALTLAYAAFGSEGSVVVLDEPASNLYPVRQLELANALKAKSKGESQLIVVTHSPSFVSHDTLSGLARVDRIHGESRLVRFSSTRSASTRRRADDIRRFPRLRSMLFARKVILFEGPQEGQALPVWFSKLAGYDVLSQQGIELGELDGETNVVRYAPLLRKFEIPFRIIGDKKNKTQPLFRKYRKQLITYPYDDFGILVRDECQRATTRALGRAPAEHEKIRAETCRSVALSAPAPPSVRELWETIKRFIESPD